MSDLDYRPAAEGDSGQSPDGAGILPVRTRSHAGRWKALAEAWAFPALFVVVAIFFSLWSETSNTFPTTANVQSILGGQAVIGILALAVLIPLVGNQFDLSVGANLGLSSVLAASVLADGASIPIAILVAIGVGGAIGVVNGLLVTRARVNSVIATLGTSIIIDGIIQWKTGGVAIVNIPASLTAFGSANTLAIPRTFIVLVIVSVFIYYLLEYTPFGRYIYSVGSNANAARLVGLNTSRLVFLSFVAAGTFSGAAGFLQLARDGGASPQVGDNFTLPALAAAFLSAAAIRPGRFNVWGLIIAIFFLAALNSGLDLAGAQTYVSDFVNGIALISGVALSGLFRRDRSAAA